MNLSFHKQKLGGGTPAHYGRYAYAHACGLCIYSDYICIKIIIIPLFDSLAVAKP